MDRLATRSRIANERFQALQQSIARFQFPRLHVHTVVLVPYRDADPRQHRSAHLGQFMDRMPAVLDEALGPGTWAIMVMEQALDGRKFCRGRVLNAGARLSRKWFPNATSYVLHDVDLLPDAQRAAFFTGVPANTLVALNTDSVFYKDCRWYIGGICALHPVSFWACNGFQNEFEGWGGEDDCLRDAFFHAVPDATIVTPTTGRIADLESAADPTSRYRCAEDPGAKMSKELKQQVKRDARLRNYKGMGLCELRFEVLAAAQLVSDTPVFKFTVDVQATSLPFAWSHEGSTSSGKLFYMDYHSRSHQASPPLPLVLVTNLVQPLEELASQGKSGEDVLQHCWAAWATLRASFAWEVDSRVANSAEGTMFSPDAALLIDIVKVLGTQGSHMPAIAAARSHLERRRAWVLPAAVDDDRMDDGVDIAETSSDAAADAADAADAAAAAADAAADAADAADAAAAADVVSMNTPGSSIAAPLPAAPVNEPVVLPATPFALFARMDPRQNCHGFPCAKMTWTEAKKQLRTVLDDATLPLPSDTQDWLLHVALAHGGAPSTTTAVTVRGKRMYTEPSNVCIPFTSLKKSL
jgi:hypothetical protein